MRSTQLTQFIKSPPAKVYQTLLDPQSLGKWKVPDGMQLEVHLFEPREGGHLSVSLTYEQPEHSGKTSAHTDTYHGRFERLIENKQIIEIDEFETDDPSLQGEMKITISLKEVPGGTELTALHEGLPAGVAAEDNESGWRMSLGKLAALMEIS